MLLCFFFEIISTFSEKINLSLLQLFRGLGAWTIGYKAWGALFARRMSQRGVLVFCLDYRNFPQGTIREMLADINRGIVWVINNAFRYIILYLFLWMYAFSLKLN